MAMTEDGIVQCPVKFYRLSRALASPGSRRVWTHPHPVPLPEGEGLVDKDISLRSLVRGSKSLAVTSSQFHPALPRSQS